MRTKKTLGTIAITGMLLTGASVTSATTASAEAPCVSNNHACDGSDSPPMSQGEKDCYKGAAWGGLPALLTGNLYATLAGAGVGCV